jgi:hypothetical protein
MNTPVAGFGKQEPCDAVQNEADSCEQGHQNDEEAHQEWVYSEAMGQTRRDSADPPVIGAPDPNAADGVDEGVKGGAGL